MTKAKFMEVYRAGILEAYGNDWAADAAKLERFMASVHRTIYTQASTWNLNSPVAVKAWRTIGGKGKPTYKGLRALAEI